eukprot:4127809-Prorocentrum_lima.AAC.1
MEPSKGGNVDQQLQEIGTPEIADEGAETKGYIPHLDNIDDKKEEGDATMKWKTWSRPTPPSTKQRE